MTEPLDLERIYVQHAPALRRWLLTRCHDADVAEELLSQVFESAVRGAPRYEERGAPISAWLHRIAHSRLVDYYRRERRRAHFVAIEDCVLADDGGIAFLEARLDATPVLGLLEQLSPDQRTVIALRFLEDQSLREIATRLGRSVEAVKAVQHRAIAGLREQLPHNAPDRIVPIGGVVSGAYTES